MARLARQHHRGVELARAKKLDLAYLEARIADDGETNSAADETLGRLVDGLAEMQHIESRVAAWKIEEVYRLRRHTEINTQVTTSNGMRPWSQAATARRVAVTELAAVLRVPEPTAQTMLDEAKMLMERLPMTMTGLRAGDFSYRHAKTIVANAESLSDDLHAEFEAAVVPHASKLTFSKFDQLARTTRERMDAKTIKERHQKAFGDREIYFEPARDGMGWLHQFTSATIGLGSVNRADEMARELAENPDETRTLMQLRSDVMSDLLLDGVVGNRPEFGIRPSVVVTVPVLAMLGLQGEKKLGARGESALPVLEGYGPIDVETATKLAGAAKSWLRVLTHPETGVVLSVGRDRYKVPAALRSFLRLRDGTCRKPGCNRPAVRCDLDHSEEWQHGGQTAHDNLAHLCQMHHDEKHHTAVKVKQLPNGDLEWTMTSGRKYISEPAERFVHTEDVDPGDFDPGDFDPGDFDARDFDVAC